MSLGPVVSNASPIIALRQVRCIDLLPKLFPSIWIPPAVTRETFLGLMLPDYIIEHSLSRTIGPSVPPMLGPGESETICLALESDARLVLLDDRAARRHAVSLGLPVMGVLGVLLASKRKGYIQRIQPVVDSLLDLGFRVAAGLRDQVLRDAGELA